jgi:histidine ammonia-lyase
VQDPYCIRCQPQVAGAALICCGCRPDTGNRSQCGSDNPLVLVEEGKIVSGGNFHAEPVAFAADQIALAIAEIGAIAQRRVALMVDPALSFDLPPFLTREPGLNSGPDDRRGHHRCADEREQTSRQSLLDRFHAHQRQSGRSCLDGCPRRAPIGTHERQSQRIIGVELLCAAQGVEFRAPLQDQHRCDNALESSAKKSLH